MNILDNFLVMKSFSNIHQFLRLCSFFFLLNSSAYYTAFCKGNAKSSIPVMRVKSIIIIRQIRFQYRVSILLEVFLMSVFI